MVHTRGQRRVEAAVEHNRTVGSAALPDELLLRVLARAMMDDDGLKRWSGAVRLSRRWRALHDVACTRLDLQHSGVTDAGFHALCGRLPALKTLILSWVTSLSANGLRAVGGVTALTVLDLCHGNVTDALLRELRGRTALTKLNLNSCVDVTIVGLRELRGFTALTDLNLGYCPGLTDAVLLELRGLTALTKLFLFGCSFLPGFPVQICVCVS